MVIEDGLVVIDVRNTRAIVSRWRERGGGFYLEEAANWEELEELAAEIVDSIGGALTLSGQYPIPPNANVNFNKIAEWEIPAEDWISLKEAARLAGVSPQIIVNQIALGRLMMRENANVSKHRENRRQVRRSQVLRRWGKEIN